VQCLEESTASVCRMNCEKLSQRPRHLIRACLTLLWKRLDWPRQRMGYDDWNRLAELIAGTGAISLPGRIEARRRGTMLVLRRADA